MKDFYAFVEHDEAGTVPRPRHARDAAHRSARLGFEVEAFSGIPGATVRLPKRSFDCSSRRSVVRIPQYERCNKGRYEHCGSTRIDPPHGASGFI